MINLETYADGDRTQGTHPSVTAFNSNGDNNDGTPFMDEMVNDIWGFYQACLYQCGLSPSGSNEVYSNSQVLQSLKNICSGPGEIVYYGGSFSRLNNSDKRLLPLFGTTVLVANYQELVDEVWDESENATTEGFYRCTDIGGVNRSVSGAYLHLPNYKGCFIRGYDNGYKDPDTRAVNSLQDDKVKDHSHYIKSPLLTSGFYGKSFSNLSASGSTKFLGFYESTNDRAVASESPSGTIAEETRPVNRNVIICVRY